jgi:hypothetical protein
MSLHVSCFVRQGLRPIVGRRRAFASGVGTGRKCRTGKELGRNAIWMVDEEKKLISADATYAYFDEIRDDPVHHLIVQPLEKKTVEVIDVSRCAGGLNLISVIL